MFAAGPALGRPARTGFSRTHPMGRERPLFSWTATGVAGHYNLVNKGLGTLTGAATFSNAALVGPKLSFGSSTAIKVAFAGTIPAVVEKSGTFWLIGSFNIFNNFCDIISTGSGSSTGWSLENNNTGLISMSSANAGASGVTLTAAVPYLIIVSWGPTLTTDYVLNFYAKRLDTGAILTNFGVVAASAPTAGAGTLTLGASNLGATEVALSAAAYCQGYLTPSQIAALAIDPWGPWRTDPLPPEAMVVNKINPKYALLRTYLRR